MRLFLLLACVLLASCGMKGEKKYIVICQFGSMVHETESKDEAFRIANDLTSMGRALASKPQYYVLENK